MKKHTRFAASLWDGPGSSISVFRPVRLQRMTGTDLDRMRGDARRVGETMREVVTRESARYRRGQNPSEQAR